MEIFLKSSELLSFCICEEISGFEPEDFVVFDEKGVPRLPNGKIHGKVTVKEDDGGRYYGCLNTIGVWNRGILENFQCNDKRHFLSCNVKNGVPDGKVLFENGTWKSLIIFEQGRAVYYSVDPVGRRSLLIDPGPLEVWIEWPKENGNSLIVREKQGKWCKEWEFFGISLASEKSGDGHRPSAPMHNFEDFWHKKPLYVHYESSKPLGSIKQLEISGPGHFSLGIFYPETTKDFIDR